METRRSVATYIVIRDTIEYGTFNPFDILPNMHRCLSILLICFGVTSTGAEFGRNQASVSTVLLKLGDNRPVGFKATLTATVTPKAAPQQTARAATGINGDMGVVMNEAARFVGDLYGDEWPSESTVEFSLSDSYLPQDVPSSSLAFVVLLATLREGFEVNDRCAVIGDMLLDGRTRDVGDINARLRGAYEGSCQYATVPLANQPQVIDLMLTGERYIVWQLQIFSVAHARHAVQLVRTDHNKKLAAAIDAFVKIQAYMKKHDGNIYGNEQIRESLNEVLALAPNHLSARVLLSEIQGELPKHLSLERTIAEFSALSWPYLALMAPDRQYQYDGNDTSDFNRITAELDELKYMAHPKMVTAIQRLIGYGEYIKLRSNRDDAALRRADAIREELEKLRNDPEIMELEWLRR